MASVVLKFSLPVGKIHAGFLTDQARPLAEVVTVGVNIFLLFWLAVVLFKT